MKFPRLRVLSMWSGAVLDLLRFRILARSPPRGGWADHWPAERVRRSDFYADYPLRHGGVGMKFPRLRVLSMWSGAVLDLLRFRILARSPPRGGWADHWPAESS